MNVGHDEEDLSGKANPCSTVLNFKKKPYSRKFKYHPSKQNSCKMNHRTGAKPPLHPSLRDVAPNSLRALTDT